MGSVGLLAGCLLLGGVAGLLNNAMSYRAQAFVEKAGSGAAWTGPTLFALQFILRMAVSLFSLYGAYRLSSGEPMGVFLNLAGLLAAHYHFIRKVSR